MNLHQYILLFALVVIMEATFAGEVEIVKIVFVQQDKSWRVDTTLRHNDSGWKHFADAWRIVNSKGKVLGSRKLLHPHVNEQPFTRSLYGVVIEKEDNVVFIEAHDKIHGWSKQRIRVDLNQRQGRRFRVKR